MTSRRVRRAAAALVMASMAAGCGRSGVPAFAPEDGATPEPTGTSEPTPTPVVGPGVYGDGRDGPLALAADELVPNACDVVLGSGPSELTLASGGLAAPGDLLLVVQVQGGASATSGDPSPVTAGEATVTGRWELAYVASASGTAVVVTAPLAHAYASDSGRRAQACRVPQYTSVSVASGASLVASAWDGDTGGIVALVANGTVTIDGAIHASGLGFRGGAPSLESPNSGSNTVTLADTSDTDGGEKGESLDVAAWSLNGRGNVHSGAGGGNKRSSGGGGGGSGGAGGSGGFENGSQDDLTRGQGGALYDPALADRLFFGGGGGGGHRGGDGAAGRGGAGGGIVLVLAPSVGGSGVLAADGSTGGEGQDSDSGSGAGGGGAGGSLLVSFETGSIALSAIGGDGGDSKASESACGPGGGGGGGSISRHAPGGPPASVDGGASGTAEATSDAYGSTDGATGRVTDF